MLLSGGRAWGWKGPREGALGPATGLASPQWLALRLVERATHCIHSPQSVSGEP